MILNFSDFKTKTGGAAKQSFQFRATISKKRAQKFILKFEKQTDKTTTLSLEKSGKALTCLISKVRQWDVAFLFNKNDTVPLTLHEIRKGYRTKAKERERVKQKQK